MIRNANCCPWASLLLQFSAGDVGIAPYFFFFVYRIP